MQQLWFPSADVKDSKITGRFDDFEHDFTDRDGNKKSRTVTMLYHKIPGSQDVSGSVVKPYNKDELIKRFPLAWADYEKRKAAQATEPAPVPTAVEYGIKGTPIEEANFIGKDRMAFLKLAGFLTLEQVAEMSDGIAQNISGAKMMRKKSAEYLKEKADEAKMRKKSAEYLKEKADEAKSKG